MAKASFARWPMKLPPIISARVAVKVQSAEKTHVHVIEKIRVADEYAQRTNTRSGQIRVFGQANVALTRWVKRTLPCTIASTSKQGAKLKKCINHQPRLKPYKPTEHTHGKLIILYKIIKGTPSDYGWAYVPVLLES